MKDKITDIDEIPENESLKPPRLPSCCGADHIPANIMPDPVAPVTIHICRDPLPEDNKSTCVYLSPDGKYHEVFGFIFSENNETEFLNNRYTPVFAVQVNIHGRVAKIFMSPETAKEKKENR